MPSEFWLGDRRVLPDLLTVDDGTSQVRLERKIMAVLHHLAACSPNVVTHTALMEAVWPGAAIGDDVLYRAITVLRKVLGDTSREARMIESIPRVGYRIPFRVQIREASYDPQPGQQAGESVSADESLGWFALRVEPVVAAPPLLTIGSHIERLLAMSGGGIRAVRSFGGIPAQRRYALRIGSHRGAHQTIHWELTFGPRDELLAAHSHEEVPEALESRAESLAEMILDSVSQELRAHRRTIAELEPSPRAKSYWELLILADHYRSMEAGYIEARLQMLLEATNRHPRLAAGIAALADMRSWQLANGLASDGPHTKQEVIERAALALELEPDSPYVLARCGAALGRIGEHARSVELCRRSSALVPSNASREALAMALCFAGEPDEAIAIYRDIMERLPSGRVIHYGRLAVACAQAGQSESALTFARLATIHYPNDYFCWALLANLLAARGELAEAAEALDQIRRLAPEVTLKRLISGTVRTYGRTEAQVEALTVGLRALAAQALEPQRYDAVGSLPA